jgi:hypothetical protein
MIDRTIRGFTVVPLSYAEIFERGVSPSHASVGGSGKYTKAIICVSLQANQCWVNFWKDGNGQ